MPRCGALHVDICAYQDDSEIIARIDFRATSGSDGHSCGRAVGSGEVHGVWVLGRGG